MKINRKFKVYNALYKSLGADGFSKPGSVATLLLELFLEDGGRLQSAKVIGRELCVEGKFSSWRDDLVSKGWLQWSLTQIDKGQYHPGKNLLAYVNKEKMASKEIVTRDDILPKEQIASKSELENTQRELEAVKERLSKLEDAVERGIEGFLDENPPKTPERRRKAKENFENTGKIFVN